MVLAIIIVTLYIGSRKRFELTPVLMLSNLIIFFIEILTAPGMSYIIYSPVVQDLAFQPIDLTNGKFYTLFTSMFLHGDFVAHLLGNMLFLFLLGSPLEQRIGKGRFAAVYFIAGLAGTLVMGFIEVDNPFILVLGASGAISGAMGALMILYPRDQIPMMVGPLLLPRVPVWLAALSWFLLSVFQFAVLSKSGVAWEAHLSGFIAGAVVARVLGRKEVARQEAASKPSDLSALEPLATTPSLRNALDMIQKEENSDIRRAWLEYFAEHAQCPQCSGRMRYQNNKLICPCGQEFNVR